MPSSEWIAMHLTISEMGHVQKANNVEIWKQAYSRKSIILLKTLVKCCRNEPYSSVGGRPNKPSCSASRIPSISLTYSGKYSWIIDNVLEYSYREGKEGMRGIWKWEITAKERDREPARPVLILTTTDTPSAYVYKRIRETIALCLRPEVCFYFWMRILLRFPKRT
jgi:hypothetical protein